MTIPILALAGAMAALLCFASNWLALIPWRKTRGRHWSERARTFHPVRVAAVSNLWVLPAVLTLATVLAYPETSPYWPLTLLLTAICALVGTIPLDREVFPRIAFKDLLRAAAVNMVIRFLLWFVFLSAAAFMPPEFNAQGLLLAGIVLAFFIGWDGGGWIWFGRLVGAFRPPPARLSSIVQETASKMNVAVRDVKLVASPMAQAFAMPATRRLLFTERILQVLSDDELAAVCAHELAHLTEGRREYLGRYVAWLMFFPWLFVNPAVRAWNVPGFLLLCLITMLAGLLLRKFSHKLEVRADAIARQNEPDSGSYARALARIYEDGLLPVVNPKKRATHPHLYDRLIAAGVTPDFPRPDPAQSIAPHGTLFAIALGALAATFIIQMVGFR